ncbi:MAG: hypothetical protein ACK5Y6_08185 [Pseudomonadota bacterium]|jgi:hypothetical protein
MCKLTPDKRCRIVNAFQKFSSKNSKDHAPLEAAEARLRSGLIPETPINDDLAEDGHPNEIRPQKRRLTTPEPTHVPPGTIAKVEVLRQRRENGQKLWHPDDAPDLSLLSEKFCGRFGVKLPDEFKVRDSRASVGYQALKTDSNAVIAAARSRLVQSGKTKRAKLEGSPKHSPLSSFMSRRAIPKVEQLATNVPPKSAAQEPPAAEDTLSLHSPLKIPPRPVAQDLKLDEALLAIFHSVRYQVAAGIIAPSALSDFLADNPEFRALLRNPAATAS